MIVRSVLIGRASDCDICVADDDYVSPRHARIDQHDNGQYILQDIGSTNGTFVLRPGLPVAVKVRIGAGIELRPGDRVRVGRTAIPWKDSR